MKAFGRILSQLILLLALSLSASSETSNSLPTLYLIGDSTVNTPTKGQQGWGTPLPAFFDQSKIAVVNRARGGRSSRTFCTEGLWDQVHAFTGVGLGRLKSGNEENSGNCRKHAAENIREKFHRSGIDP